MRNPIFFVGTGRCGTTSVAVSISECTKNTVVLHEGDRICGIDRFPLFMGYGPSIWRLSTRDNFEVQNGNFDLARKVFSYRENYIRSIKSTYIESNNFAWPYIPIIREKFPDAYIVNIVRNPYDCVSSMYSWGYYLRQDHYNDSRPLFKCDNRLEAVCHFWEYVNKSINDLNPDYTIKLEEMTDDVLAGILDICNIDYNNLVVRSVNSLPKKIQREEVIYTVNECISDELFEMFKYERLM